MLANAGSSKRLFYFIEAGSGTRGHSAKIYKNRCPKILLLGEKSAGQVKSIATGGDRLDDDQLLQEVVGETANSGDGLLYGQAGLISPRRPILRHDKCGHTW